MIKSFKMLRSTHLLKQDLRKFFAASTLYDIPMQKFVTLPKKISPALQKPKSGHKISESQAEMKALGIAVLSCLEEKQIEKNLETFEELLKNLNLNTQLSAIDVLFVTCVESTNHPTKLIANPLINLFINDNLNQIEGELAESENKPICSTPEIFNQRLKLCASFFLANFKDIKNAPWYYDLLKRVSVTNSNEIAAKKIDVRSLHSQFLIYLTYVSIYSKDFDNPKFMQRLSTIREFLLTAARDEQFFLEQYTNNLRNNSFRLTPKAHNDLSYLNYLLAEKLTSEKPSSKILNLTRDFLHHQQLLAMISTLESRDNIPYRTINTLINYCMLSRRLPQQEFLNLTIAMMNSLIETIQLNSPAKITYLCDLLSQFEVYKIHQTIYHKFWISILDYLIHHGSNIALRQWVVLFYSLGKSGFINQEFLEKVYYPKLDPKNYAKFADNPDLFKYLVNLIQFGFKNKLIQAKDIGSHKETLVKLLAKNKKEGWDLKKLNVYAQLVTTLCRHEIFDYELWEPFFENLNELISSDRNSSYKVTYVYKHLEIFSDVTELHNHPKTKEAFTVSKEKHPRVQEIIENPLKKSKIHEQIQAISLTHEFMQPLLESKIHIVSEAAIGNVIVDYLIPDKKLVIEVHGQHHYIKPAMEKNSITEYAEKVIKKLGYNLIEVPLLQIPGQSVEISADLYLFRELEKYFILKD